jgi:2,3-bisphosphoglycerate-dependent phosphoglycerate mutase
MRIVIIRHGQTKANVINDKGTSLYTGTLNNELTSLTEQGKNQASVLENNDIIKSIEKVYSSDLIRAMQTAKLAKPGYELILSKDLRERCLGIFEGKEEKDLLLSDEYNKYITDEKFNKFRTDFVQKAPDGESYTDVSIRCKRFLDSLNFNDDITIGIFSHYHLIRCLFLNMFKIEPKERVFKLQIQHCVPYVIEGDNIDNLKLISHNLNDMFKK